MDLKEKVVQLRKGAWQLIYSHKSGHTGSDLSCVGILAALYCEILKQTPDTFEDKDADAYIQSEGHAVGIWYGVLAGKGYIDQDDLDKHYSTFNSPYIGHPTADIKGMEFHTGSLGRGLGLGVGVALTVRTDHSSKRTFVLMGDSEQVGGSAWETAMAASNYGLGNLTAIVDHNDLQIMGTTDPVMRSDPINNKYRAFGRDTVEVNGNGIDALVNILNKPSSSGRPRVIIVNTVKGKGITIAENRADRHHKIPSEAEYQEGLRRLGTQLEGLNDDQ